jgi:RimJ/RimL family protein N-acetyltransferase
MFEDTDGEGDDLFKDLATYVSVDDGIINGFIQIGISNFHFDSNGKNFGEHVGIIRNICYDQSVIGELLIEKATEYFEIHHISENYAFYHYFGMGCYARHGKLYESNFYIEDLLSKYDFEKEHENVYYSKNFKNGTFLDVDDIEFKYKELTKGNHQSVQFIKNGVAIGGCQLHYLHQSGVCYLRWIYITDKYNHQGLGTECMNKLFFEIHKKGYKQIDTDTADNNVNAQFYYLKMGFVDKGRTRSYFKISEA